MSASRRRAPHTDPKSLKAGRALDCQFGVSPAWIADNIASLLNRLRDIPLIESNVSSSRLLAAPAPELLAAMLDKMRSPIPAVKGTGVLATPWAAAMLRRDEVRTASVLSWFLSPRGNHGCGDWLLRELLAHIGRKLDGDFPTSPSPQSFVTVEECPDGDRSSRVDIQIDDPKFFIVIEVKINATEQPDQIHRYCGVAAERTGGARPWCVVFLTTDGRHSKTGANERVIAMSWSQVAASLRRVNEKADVVQKLNSAQRFNIIPRFLAASFADHISNL